MGILKNDFLPQNDVIFRISEIFEFLVKTVICMYPKHNLVNSTYFGVQDTQICPEKEANILRG